MLKHKSKKAPGICLFCHRQNLHSLDEREDETCNACFLLLHPPVKRTPEETWRLIEESRMRAAREDAKAGMTMLCFVGAWMLLMAVGAWFWWVVVK